MRSITGTITDDGMIRQAVRAKLTLAHAGQDAVIVDELKVSRGSSRIDVAVVNGHIEGYEIKSDKDTLDRLPRQVRMFGLIADRMTLVVGERHLADSASLIPEWWSILVPSPKANGSLKLSVARRGRLNRSRDVLAMVEVLERNEILAMMAAQGLDKGLRSASYGELSRIAATRLPLSTISHMVKRLLKVRAALDARFADSSFGRNAIICSGPSVSDVGLP